MLDFENYLSPFTWRYASAEMRSIWSESHKRYLWRTIWLALAEVQAEYGLITADQLDDLRSHVNQVDVPRSLEIEADIHHDLMAELKAFAEQAPVGGAVLHLGATSTDIEDNADAIRMCESLDLILSEIRQILLSLAEKIDQWAAIPMIAFTHLQPAEPSTLGYRLAQYAQDLQIDWNTLSNRRQQIRGKGFKGAVGTAAAYAQLIGADKLPEFESRMSKKLGLPFFPVATQVYPRKQDYLLVSELAAMGISLHKFAFDLRILQSPVIGEWSEPFAKDQVGSSAMPFKRNPIHAEKIDSLARYLAQLPRLAWDNAAHSLLERTLDDSANRRLLLPEAFLVSDELLNVASRVIKGLKVNGRAIAHNLEIYSPFAGTERVLMALVKAGADRQEMHTRLREHALAAWDAIQQGLPNPLIDLISTDRAFIEYIPEDKLRDYLDARSHIGDAPERAKSLADRIRGGLK